MTTTALYTAQAVGGTPGNVQPTKTTAQAASSAFVVSVEVTAGNGVPSPAPKFLRLRYSSSPFSYAAAAAVAILGPTARSIDLPVPMIGGQILVVDSTFEALTGQFIYTWLETEGFANTLGVTASLQEV